MYHFHLVFSLYFFCLLQAKKGELFFFFVEYIIDKITGIIYLGDDMNIKIFIKKQERFVNTSFADWNFVFLKY